MADDIPDRDDVASSSRSKKRTTVAKTAQGALLQGDLNDFLQICPANSQHSLYGAVQVGADTLTKA